MRSDGRGRPWKNNREVLHGIIWILCSGARWKDLPRDFPSYQTCDRRFQQWVTDGTQNLLSNAPERLIGDGAYDSDRVDERLEEKEIEMIAPHRKNRVAPAAQDGR